MSEFTHEDYKRAVKNVNDTFIYDIDMCCDTYGWSNSKFEENISYAKCVYETAEGRRRALNFFHDKLNNKKS